jgi:hypothetical protein
MEKLSNQTDSRAKWLRSKDVRAMLGISDSTLQTLRINGTIPAYRLGASWYYQEEEILHALETNKLRIGGKYDE